MKKYLYFLMLAGNLLYAQVDMPKDSVSSDAKDAKQNIHKLRNFIIPSGLFIYGFAELNNNSLRGVDSYVKDFRTKNIPNFHNKIDDIAQFSPAMAAFGLKALGVEGKNNWKKALVVYAGSVIITTSIVTPIKSLSKKTRPDGSADNSFPSGHTATAFAAAEFLRTEYRDTSPWIGIAGYSVATGVGIMRVFNNRHWLSDVVAGAGIGVASTKLSYLLVDKFSVDKKLKNNYALFISKEDKIFCFNLVYKF
ncbi:phosphatase PAP2 family protein [Ornithobacterium rhinotracheale]|uniref:phosphatase PAP2 family protein n=1 Tax=Ornithobacterium rhinotracheale TaxID=28251 RepID=UPI0040375086